MQNEEEYNSFIKGEIRKMLNMKLKQEQSAVKLTKERDVDLVECLSVTKDKPCILTLSGDVARVSIRGNAITMCGPKIADPQLPCQQATGKTSNRSRHLYTQAIAGYVDETSTVKFTKERDEIIRQNKETFEMLQEEAREKIRLRTEKRVRELRVEKQKKKEAQFRKGSERGKSEDPIQD
jgi:hypothetical protein